MKRFFSLVVIVGFAQTIQAQVYTLNLKKDLFIGGSSVALLGTSYFLNKNMSPLSLTQISKLNSNSINRLDRYTVNNFDLNAEKQSKFPLYSAFVLGASTSLALPYSIKTQTDKWIKEAITIETMWLELNLWNIGLSNTSKVLTKRTRPYVYNSSVNLSIKQKIDARKSFFSRSTALSCGNMFFIAKSFNDYCPESKLKPYIWGLASLVPTWTAYLKIKAGQHFPTDVITGYFIGAVTGYLIPVLHKHKEHSKDGPRISIHPIISPHQGSFLIDVRL